MIELQHVSKTFENAGGRVDALRDVSLTIADGDIYGIIGMSGAGKSTLVRCINMLERPTEGRVIVNGQQLDAMTPAQLRAARREITMIFQRFNLLMQRTCLQNICFPMELAGVGRKEAQAKAWELLELVGLPDKAQAYPAQLSGGQQQRVALARILCSEPEAILLDEPFSALDSYLKWNLEIELADLLATFNGPILWVSHDRDECYRNCRSVCVMEDGRTGEVTPMDEMIRHPGSVSAARLAGCKNFFAAEARDGKVYLPEWNVALPLAGMENTFTTIGIPDNAVTMSENGAMSCTVCRMILGVEENILLLRPEGSVEGAPMLRITVGHESDLQAGAAVRVALDDSKLLLL